MTTDPLQPDRSLGVHPPAPEMRVVPEGHELSAVRVVRVLRDGPRHRVSLAETADGSRIVLKQLRAGHAHASARLRLQREQRMLALAQGDFVPRLLALQLDAPEPTLVLAVAEGEPLSTLAGAELAAADVMAIAHQAALALQGIHRAGVLHLDLSPLNLLWSAAARRLTVVDFSSAMRLQGEEAHAGSPLGSEGTLPCMSPEQAGLMNRPVDKRSDLYSLGITLYTLAAGRGPFSAEDALGWAHAHLTARPEPLATHRPDLPAPFCAVLHKLIAKSPDDRYQTAWGLAHDLALCRDAWQAGPPFAELELGQRDVSDHLNGAPGLHGREREVALLGSAWQRAAAGSAELLLIAGDAGIGKTSLVHGLWPAVAARGGLFVAGKFDALGQSLPYSALVAALAAWVDQRLADGGGLRAGWRTALDSALAPDQAALCGLLPRLSLLLGPQAEPPALDARGTERRLQRAVAALLGVICSETHPLLWLIDDLQWADPGSLALLQSLVAAGLPPWLMLVVASRPTPAGVDGLDAEPLLRRASAEAGRPLQALALPPLDAAASTALVRDILRAPAEREAELAGEVYGRTAGNPFAVASLLAHLRGAEVLSFDPDRLRWHWRPQALAALDASEGMVGLLLQQAARLPAETGRLLGVGACIGREFSLAEIADLTSAATAGELDIAATGAPAAATATAGALTPAPARLDAVEAALQPACAARFLVQRLVEGAPEGDPAAGAGPHLVYRFVHDRVQEMAQGLLDERERRAVHSRIGQALWAGGASGDALFTAVNHLNLGTEPAQTGEQPGPPSSPPPALTARRWPR